MKKKISALLFIVCILSLVCSLSSCVLLDGGLLKPDKDDAGGDTNITVNSGGTNNITVNSSASSEVVGASKALLSSVSIFSSFERYVPSGIGQGKKESYASTGSGVIYWLDKDRGNAYIITNYHVIYDADSITKNKISDEISVLLYGQEYTDYLIEATYVGGSMTYDLAILEVKGSQVLMKSAAGAVSVADSNNVAVLEKVIAIGNPEGGGISATVGYINVESEEITMMGSDEKTEVSLRVMRTDAAVNKGNSGGGLFNTKGELVGIVNAKIIDGDVDNIGYAIPSNVAKAIADNILYYCKDSENESVMRVLMGITVTSAETYAKYDTESGIVRRYESVVVLEVSETSPVRELIKKDDIINSITIDGKTYPITRVFHVVDSMLNARSSSSVVMNVTRGGVAMDITIPINDSMITKQK